MHGLKSQLNRLGIFGWAVLVMLCLISSCRGDDMVIPSETTAVGEINPASSVAGFYLLNEGNMGSNKCTLDFYDYSSGNYLRNIYAERNPNVVKELGDVGNDLKIYGSKLYAVINCSHKVEVMDVNTGIRVGQIDIPNCRYICFKGDKAYVSSYVGPVQISQDAPKGMVYEVDTLSLAVTRRVTVGYQPEEMAIVNSRLYVANSGGYRAPNYDNTVSVVDLESFKQIKQIQVAINLHRLRVDSHGQMWVTSRGNNADIASSLALLTPSSDLSGDYELSELFDIPCSNIEIYGDTLYYVSTQWSNITQSNTVSYGMFDVVEHKQLDGSFITDGTDAQITIPYALAVNPDSGDLFVADAKNYVSSGMLYCFGTDGKLKWNVRTGDIPSSIAFVLRNAGKEADK